MCTHQAQTAMRPGYGSPEAPHHTVAGPPLSTTLPPSNLLHLGRKSHVTLQPLEAAAAMCPYSCTTATHGGQLHSHVVTPPTLGVLAPHRVRT